MINSGKCIITEFYEFKANPELIREFEEKKKPLVMTGILQKADTLNRNGRIYPYQILKREVDKYMELVESGTAGGELDHPDCQTFDSKILTKDGWKFLPEISEDEEILTINIQTGKIEIQKIENKIDQEYNGDLYHISGKNIDIKVTPNHRFLVHDRNGKPKYITAEEIYSTNTNKLSIPKKGDWEGIDCEYFELPGEVFFKDRTQQEFINKNNAPIKIKSEDWFEFMGWYLSEGTSSGVVSKRHEENSQYFCKLTQVKEDAKEKIEDLFNRLPFSKRKCNYEGGKVDYIFTDKRLHNYLHKLGSSSEKYIPTEIKQASPRLLKILFDAFLLGDGRTVRKYYYKKDDTKKQSVFSTSQKLIEDLHEILLKMGGCGNITTYQPKNREIVDTNYIDNEIDNGDGTLSLVREAIKTKRVIKSENSKLQYNLNIASVDRIYLDKRFIKVEKIKSDGKVYCVRVKNGNFYTMRNGKSHWTGNSAIISLANVSHRVTDMWWQGKDLYGKVLVAEETSAGKTLKGLLKAGFMLGISSRGVGSVKSVDNKDMVQEDFELIGFDFVSSPSTPGAYLFKEGKDLAKKGMFPLEGHMSKGLKLDTANPKEQYEHYTKLHNLANSNFWKNI